MLDYLLRGKMQAQSGTGFEHLLEPNNLDTIARNYPIACKVEGKSPRTIEAYGSTLDRFIRQVKSPIVTVGDIRSYLVL